MNTRLLLLLPLLLLAACGTAPAAPSAPPATDAATATLQFRANGEDFVRQGFITKDGWQISFEHLYVTLSNITAHQADPPYDALAADELQAVASVALPGTHTVDLAAGDETAEPILIGEVAAPAGRYNALSWDMVRASEGPASGAVVLLVGTASKDGTSLPFTIQLDRESSQTCGDFVGDERKGILAANSTADLEATFHFDHLFGDGEAAPDDEINTSALGFEPFARLAQAGSVTADSAAMQANFTPDELALLEEMHLPHVGEGHCNSTVAAASGY